MMQENACRICLPLLRADGKMEAKIIDNLSRDVEPGAYGVEEPHQNCTTADPAQIRAVIVPGRAFTLRGERLGRGGGHYDRFLAGLPARKIALAYRCQIFPELPQDEHDIRMDEVIVA